MGRKSTIETLPEDILAELQRLMLDPRITQLQVTQQINALLVEQGSDERISKSAVGRYAINFEELTAEMVETDRMAAVMLKEMKIDNKSDIGMATAETLRVMLYRFLPMMREAIASNDMSLGTLKELTAMMNMLNASHEKLERSATVNEKRRRDIEKEATLKANQAAAETMAKTAKAEGISDETISIIRTQLLGFSQ